MRVRNLLVLLSVAVGGVFGQVGLYGPVSVHLKAGDVAPDISFARMLSAPGAASWSQANLTGQVTVVVFYPDTTDNPEPVKQWNALVEKFAGKPVQFVWVTGEEDSKLLPWLNQNPVKGWVFDDPEGKTGKAYGLEEPVEVIVGADRKIVGFSWNMLPREDQLNAVMEGRVTTTPPTHETIKAFMESKLVLLNAEPPKMPRIEDTKPKFAPSYALHVSISKGEGRGTATRDDYIGLTDFLLKDAITFVYGVNSIRVQLPATLDDGKRYDFALVLPEPESQEKVKERFRKGLEAYFHLTTRPENRLMDVYVVTVDANHKPVMKPRSENGMGFLSESWGGEGVEDEERDGSKPVSLGAITSDTITGTADFFCHNLEDGLDRPVVNETNLQGEFEVDVEEPAEGAKNDFLERLWEKTGLVISPGQRNVEVLVFEGR
jgi:uncharacterized protein (TIGR03435 family)